MNSSVRTVFIEAGGKPVTIAAPASYETMVDTSKALGYSEVASIEGVTGRVWQGEKITDDTVYLVTHKEETTS